MEKSIQANYVRFPLRSCTTWSSAMLPFIFQATDLDSGEYGSVSYSLAGGNDR